MLGDNIFGVPLIPNSLSQDVWLSVQLGNVAREPGNARLPSCRSGQRLSAWQQGFLAALLTIPEPDRQVNSRPQSPCPLILWRSLICPKSLREIFAEEMDAQPPLPLSWRSPAALAAIQASLRALTLDCETSGMRPRPSYFCHVSRLVCALSAVSVLGITGCGDGKIKRFPVTCTVNVDGKPAAGAMVIFCPVDGPPELMRQRPAGITDASGKFQLTTLGTNDGVPAGKYKVLVQWPSGNPEQADSSSGVPALGRGPDRLKHKYYNLDHTPLAATIEPETKELPPFELQSK
jgi:hypothetical protein